MKQIVAVLACLTAVSCDKPAEPPAATAPAPVVETPAPSVKPEETRAEATLADDLQPGQDGFYGARFTVIEPPITLARAIELAPEHPGPLKIEATVSTVCKKKGCWFKMADEGGNPEVRVRMKDYSFFVPRNSEHARVVAEGMLTERELSQDEAQHYADDAAKEGEEPQKVEGPQKVWEFTATAVELQAAES